MKKTIFLLMLIISGFVFGQDIPIFQFSNSGFNNNVVYDVPNQNKEEIYNKVVEWVNINYKNPENVIKGKIENEYIRIEGYNDNGICNKFLGSLTCWGLYYTLEINIKDNKYKLSFFDIHTFEKEKQSIDIYQKTLYDKNGSLKKSGETIYISLNKSINDISVGLNQYLKNKTKINSDW